ncbi:Toxin RTX-I translocation ATP-binding protein [Zhongshania aliphaticivorans]|uniref:Toxin RTX-I translocation ATP-binding protein n=1 Tax=Zhongshania aliphaticivorans TaxID=1470434 RepID=A0A5S9PRM1_9GAMM|nr:type I secretion system permease/ATPase [Zhongshania aliphaticivorans]CAA0107237.1 Toxin RTX-I translocation ATP-binding protein [Zhongshania aliphaticivorans]CAA0107309.1 Toxin RTX-I translocation ATP-binding protein [Zhongshania aliphaticivorans]
MTQIERAYDPLLNCLVIFSRLYNRPVSADALVSGLPVEPGERGPELFSIERSRGMFQRVAKRAGFASRLIKRDLSEVSDLLLPCILVLENRDACILESIDHGGRRARVIYPDVDDGAEWVDLEKLNASYMGFAFLLKKVFKQESATRKTLNVKRGHWFWGTLKRSKDVFVSIIVASVVINFFVIAMPLFTMNIYDRVVPNDALETLWVLALGILVVHLFDMGLKFLRAYFIEVGGKKSDIIMSSILFEQVLNLKMSQWPRSVGAFANNLREFESIRAFFTASTLSTLVDLPFTILLLILVAYIGGPIVVVPIAIIVLQLLYSFYVTKPLRESIEATFEASSNKNAHLIESLHSIQTIKALGTASHSQWVWEESSGAIAHKSMRSRLLSNSVAVVTQFLMQVNTVAIIIFGVYRIGDQDLSLGGLIALVMLSSRAVAPVGQVATLISQYQQTRAAFASLDEIMNMPVERPENKQYVRRPRFDGHIEFKNVSFSYPEAAQASLSDISFEIQPGEHVGIIGKVGSGKSSLARLLIGLYEPSGGSISIDGINSNQIDPADLRQHIGYLSQDIQLMRGTIRDNLIYRDPQVDDAQLLKTARLCGVDQFVNKLPSGFDTQVGEQGACLSGGQRQAIALGRAMLLDEPILVLDEPTSNMDNSTEFAIRKQLFEHTRDKTLLLITHKAVMLELVERLIVVEDGRVLLDGPKAQVVAALKKLGK